jgi:hypothetical protein
MPLPRQNRLVLNVRDVPSNTFAWMLCRRVLYSIGIRFKKRFQAISIIMYLCGLCIVAFINIFFYLKVKHTADILLVMLIIVMYLNLPICVAILQVMRLPTHTNTCT